MLRALTVLLSLGAAWLLAGRGRPAAARTCTTSRGTSRSRESDVLRRRRGARPLVEGTVARGTLQRRRGVLHRQARPTASRREFPFPLTTPRCMRSRRSSASTSTARRATAARRAATAWSCSAATASRRRIHTTGCATRRPATSSTSMTNGFGAMPDYAAQIPVARSLGDRRLRPRPAAEPARARPTCTIAGADDPRGQAEPATAAALSAHKR